MAENSNIEWTDHTFNPWRGCVKVSPGCDHCYAETLSHRNPASLGEWGKDAKRVIAPEAYWKHPERWNREAEKLGRRARVFCASLGDVFEWRNDLAAPRLRLFDLIRRTPHLDWLLLTKRPKNIRPLIDRAFESANAWPFDHNPDDTMTMLYRWINGRPPSNVWLGTSVEDQTRAYERIPALLNVPAAGRFLSMEPLLGPVSLRRIGDGPYALDALSGEHRGPGGAAMGNPNDSPGIDWVIVGGESGSGARPMHPEWVRSLRDQCEFAHVPFLFKQWGEWVPDDMNGFDRSATSKWVWTRLDGSETERGHTGDALMVRVGKKAAGRTLYDHTHDANPFR